MYRILSLLCAFFIIVTLVSWNSKKKDEIYEIEINSMNMMARTEVSIDCNMLDSDYEQHLIIKDVITIERVVNNIKNSKRNDNTKCDFDMRAKLVLKYKSGKADTICVEGQMSRNYCINGRAMKFSDNDMFYLIESLNRLSR